MEIPAHPLSFCSSLYTDYILMTTLKSHILPLLIALILLPATAMRASSPSEDFTTAFADSTLRVDLIMSGGGGTEAAISLQGLKKWDGWAGRRHFLNKLPAPGNGTIEVIDHLSADTLYRNSFSTLFQEWLSTDEATDTQRAFENTLLLPLPLREAEIRVTLYDARHSQMASGAFRYNPGDPLLPIVRAPHFEPTYIHRSGNPDQAIDILFIPEGYTAAEADKFMEDSRRISSEILSYEPYRTYRDRFNISAVMIPSAESGVSLPHKGVWRDSAFGAHFYTFGVKKYLSSPNMRRLHDAIDALPYEHIVLLANTDEYGGAGIYNNYLMTAAGNELSLPVSVHEFGHSFGALADEYFYPGKETDQYPLDVEPWEANITTNHGASPKWEGPQYEGGGYRVKGIFRPSETCRMRDNDYPEFCPVCRSAIEKIILFYTAAPAE